jgi:hypothetical protein
VSLSPAPEQQTSTDQRENPDDHQEEHSGEKHGIMSVIVSCRVEKMMMQQVCESQGCE